MELGVGDFHSGWKGPGIRGFRSLPVRPWSFASLMLVGVMVVVELWGGPVWCVYVFGSGGHSVWIWYRGVFGVV